ncbi:hypothetical protein K501DRAFT_287773 [Backusella circina FSU 941]|nr:hypothetical protein K501DRAFT_287773 [Backusella circina FSU 941]
MKEEERKFETMKDELAKSQKRACLMAEEILNLKKHIELLMDGKDKNEEKCGVLQEKVRDLTAMILENGIACSSWKKQALVTVDEKKKKTEDACVRLEEQVAHLKSGIEAKKEEWRQMQGQLIALNEDKKQLEDGKAKLEFCGRKQRECRIKVKEENEQLGILVQDLTTKLQVALNSLHLEEEKNSALGGKYIYIYI